MSPHLNFTLAEPFTARVSSGIDSGGGSMGGRAGGWEHGRVGAWEGGSMGGWGAWEGGSMGGWGAWEGGAEVGGCMRVGLGWVGA